jgi:hypothetical protein
LFLSLLLLLGVQQLLLLPPPSPLSGLLFFGSEDRRFG